MPARPLLFITVAAIATAGFAATPAGAATVRYSVDTEGDEGGYVESHTLAVVAAAGESNDMAITVRENEVVIRDPGATFTIERDTPCTADGPNAVRCALAIFGGPQPKEREGLYAGVFAALGDGDDRLTYDGRLPSDAEGGTQLQGQAGSDTITVTRGRAVLYGGEGTDTLTGGPGTDFVSGGPGADVLAGGGGDDLLQGEFDGNYQMPLTVFAADRIDGGDGRDMVDYLLYGASVTVNLADGAADGAPGENDVLIAIEDVRGGDKDDTLIGSDGPNRLEGGAGDDTATGLAGDDAIEAETVDAGAGNDALRGILRTIACGAGTRDAVAASSLELNKQPPPADCEYVETFGALTSATPAMPNGRSARFRVRSNLKAKATLDVYLGSRRIGRARYEIARSGRDAAQTVTVRLTRTVRSATVLRVRLKTSNVRETWRFRVP